MEGGAPADAAVPDDIGAGIDDVRAHLRHSHLLRDEWVSDLGSADLHALHRRLHGRAVEPDPGLVDVHLVELQSDRDAACTTTLSIDDALAGRGLVWLPMRVADLVHAVEAPGHVGRGGCRACADVVAATIAAIVALDRTPQTERDRALHALAAAQAELALVQATVDELRLQVQALETAVAELDTQHQDLDEA